MSKDLLLQQFDLLATAPGGVTRLRELILSLAVQGKLVPQDPADESASELLKRIRAEKDRLIAAGKIKRDKPLAQIGEDEQPFGLPQGWEWVRIGTLTNISTGKLDANAAVADGQYPFFTCSNTPLAIDKYSFDCAAVLLAGNGDFNLKHYTGKFDAYQRTYVIEPLSIDLRFLYFTLKKYIGELTKNQRGSAIPYLKLGDITNPVIPIPPLPEQTRIVARVEELMRVCDALEAKDQQQAMHHHQLVQTLLGTLIDADSATPTQDTWQRVSAHFDILLDRPSAVNALEQTILQLAVRGQLVPQDPTDKPASELLQRIRAEKDRLIAAGKIKRDKPLAPIGEDEQPFDLPKGWEWVRLDAISEFTNGYAFPSGQFSADSTGVGIVKIGDIQDGEVTTIGMSYVSQEYAKTIDSTFIVMPGDMLIAMSGGTTGKLGFNLTGSHFFLNQRVGRIGLYFIDQEFAYSYLRTKVAENLAISSGSAIPNLSTAQIKDIVFPLPPLAEQARIVARVAHLRRLCTDLRQRLTQSQTTQAVLAEALMNNEND